MSRRTALGDIRIRRMSTITWPHAQPTQGYFGHEVAKPSQRDSLRTEQSTWVQQISSRVDTIVNQARANNARVDQERAVLEWAAAISHRADATLRALQIETRTAARSLTPASDQWWRDLREWSETEHPRQPKGTPAGGQFAPKGGGEAVPRSAGRGVPDLNPGSNPSDASRWYLPSDAKGEWLGEKGKSTFRLKSPVDVNGKVLREIPFKDGLPVLDDFKLPGKTATIILTGHHQTDIAHAREAWKNLNPGIDFPKDATFHHDLLNAAEEVVEINGKKVKVVVGQMQLVPKDVNSAIFHQGSASVAKKYYQGLGINVDDVPELAKKQAQLAGRSRSIVGRALSKIKPGKVPKGLVSFVGRNIIRVIPLATTGLAVFEFAENAEAHGIGGAIARATPVLGDLISAHDLGSDLAKQIRDESDAAADEANRILNKPSRDAWDQADRQTIAAFNELAARIQVTNLPTYEGGEPLVDPQEVADALHEYRQLMQHSNYKRNSGQGRNFNAEAAQHKQRLRERLERASKKNGPTAPVQLG